MSKSTKQSIAELEAYLASKNERDLKRSDLQILAVEQIRKSNIKTKRENPMTEEQKKHLSDMLRGVPFDQRVGLEHAEQQRQSRSKKLKNQKRPKQVVDKIVQTRKSTGSYSSPSHGMNNKTHKDSTKSIMSIKAQIRQELKAKLGLGRDDKLSKELLEKEYKKRGL